MIHQDVCTHARSLVVLPLIKYAQPLLPCPPLLQLNGTNNFSWTSPSLSAFDTDLQPAKGLRKAAIIKRFANQILLTAISGLTVRHRRSTMELD